MTSSVSREDVAAQAWQAGVKNPQQLARLMRVIDLYAWELARKAVPVEDVPIPVDGRSKNGTKYLCRTCGERLDLEFFPWEKQENPARPYDCTACGGSDRKQYACPECGQLKILAAFPEAKQENPRKKIPCSYCDRRKVTKTGAGYSRN